MEARASLALPAELRRRRRNSFPARRRVSACPSLPPWAMKELNLSPDQDRVYSAALAPASLMHTAQKRKKAAWFPWRPRSSCYLESV